MTVIDLSPRLTPGDRAANARAGRCHCGCPSVRSGWWGWRRCIWSYDLEFRIRRGHIRFRSRPSGAITLRGWNDVKKRSGLLDDRQVHALLLFLARISCATFSLEAHH